MYTVCESQRVYLRNGKHEREFKRHGRKREMSNVYLIGISKERLDSEREAVFQKIMTENFLELMKDMNAQDKELQNT